MTTLSVTFVICLSEQQKKLSLKSQQHRDRHKKNVSSVQETSIQIGFQDVEESPFETNSVYTINVEKPVKSLQIDYEILPKLIYNVDVLFWGPVAKIITKEKIKFVNSIEKLRDTWITFTIEHKIMLDINELLLYKLHTIVFNIRLDKNANTANVPDYSTFFFLNEDVEHNNIFAEAFEYIPNNNIDEKTQVEENVKLILQEILYFPMKREILNLLKIPDIIYRKKILNMINLSIARKPYDCFNNVNEGVNVLELFNTKSPSSAKKKVDKKLAADRKKSNTLDNIFQLNIPAEVLFTDPHMTVFNFETNNQEMRCAFIIVNADNLINPNQKSILYPIVIKLNNLINVPVEDLNKQRFEYLYLTYNICGFTCTTLAKKITSTIHYRNNQMFFLEKKIRAFAQMAQKDYLIVQILGIRSSYVTKKSEMFGTIRQDKFFSMPMRNKKEIEKYSKDSSNKSAKESVLVAVACFKLNLLFSMFRSFSQLEHCIHPSLCQLTKNVDEFMFNTFTINTINTYTKEEEETKYYPLSKDVLLDSELCLDANMELHKSINQILDCMIEQEIFFNRIVLIIGHRELAKYILANVLTHNSCWIYKDDIVPPNYLPGNESNIDINNVNIISGFSIDNGDFFIMFLEGNSKWVKNVLWRHIKNEHSKCARILYNSDHVYRERVYTNFIPYGGVYNVTLHSSLKALLASSKIFFPGYLPEPTRRAFEKLDMILKCKLLNELTMDKLPTKKELLSLDIEWGVPIHWPLTEEEEKE